MDLSEIRNKIDSIDEELLRLFIERMECSREVAQYKIARGLEVLNAAREDEILQNVFDKAGEHGYAASLVYMAIMEASRALQHGLMGGGEALREALAAGIAAEAEEVANSAKKPPEIACQGVSGAYSGEAAQILYPGARLRFVESFEDVFEAVREGAADYGVLPAENSTAGSITETYDLLLSYKYYVNRSLSMKISHCLLGIKGAALSGIKTVYSHPQGLLQCSEFLKSNNINGISCGNTAAAAVMVAEAGDEASGAVASREAAENYGLDIIAENVQNSKHNSTRFISISKKLTIPENADKISLSFSLPHKTGSLYRILARFAAAGLNLTKIESRPNTAQNFEYLFYLDFIGNLRDENTVKTLCVLSEELPDFAFLGNYYSGN